MNESPMAKSDGAVLAALALAALVAAFIALPACAYLALYFFANYGSDQLYNLLQADSSFWRQLTDGYIVTGLILVAFAVVTSACVLLIEKRQGLSSSRNARAALWLGIAGSCTVLASLIVLIVWFIAS